MCGYMDVMHVLIDARADIPRANDVGETTVTIQLGGLGRRFI